MVTMTPGRLIEMCLSEPCSKVCLGEHLSELFAIQNNPKGDALLPLPIKFASEYTVRKA
jgi:hypothetical protein